MTKSYPDIIPEAFTKHENLEDAYRRGWNHGHGIACHHVPSVGDDIRKCADHMDLGDTVTAENIRDYHLHLCHAAADYSRPSDPLEDLEGNEEDLWDAFEIGIADAIEADLSGYTDEDYAGN